MSELQFTIRPLAREDREWVAHFLDERWGSTQIVSRGRALYGHLLPGFVAERPAAPEAGSADAQAEQKDDDETEENPAVHMEKVGLLTYNVEGEDCEVVTIDSLVENIGIGTTLLNEIKAAAKQAGNLKRLWLVTTNDNMAALRFYQKRGFELVAVHRNAVAQSRRLKPQIPIIGKDGIPIRDEIELEFLL